MSDRRRDLDLDAIYPEMPSSFSKRVDGALDEVRGGHVRRRRGVRGVVVASACAAAFVAICGAALLIPALREERPAVDSVVCALTPTEAAPPEMLPHIEAALGAQLQFEAGVTFRLTELRAEHQGEKYLARIGYLLYRDGADTPFAAETAEVTLMQQADGFHVSQQQVLTHEDLTPEPEPTPDPTQTPKSPEPTPEQETGAQAETETVRKMALLRAESLVEAYYSSLQQGSGAATDALVEINENTALWFYELNLQLGMIEMGYCEPLSGDMLHNVRVDSVADGAYGYITAACNCTTVFADGSGTEETFVLTLDPQQDYLIVGIERGADNACYASLLHLVEEAMADGMTRADANAAAFDALYAQLQGKVMVAWDGQTGALLWQGERHILPATTADGQPWQTLQGELHSIALLKSGVLPVLSLDVLAMLEEQGHQALGGTVVEDGFRLWQFDGSLLTEVCSGTPTTLLKQLAQLPSGTYLVTFRFLPDQAAAEEVNAQAELTDTSPNPITEMLQFAFAVEH